MSYPMHWVGVVCAIGFVLMGVARLSGLTSIAWIWIAAPLCGFIALCVILGITFFARGIQHENIRPDP